MKLHSPDAYYIPLLVLLFALLPLATTAPTSSSPNTAQIYCDIPTFGQPDVGTANTLLFRLPFYPNPSLPPDEQAQRAREFTAERTFSEPAFLFPRFRYLQNIHAGVQMVQLPKIWKLRNMRLAVLSFADSYGAVRNAEFAATWAAVAQAVNALLGTCVNDRRTMARVQGGAWVSDVAVIYLYVAGSRFEESVNWYMCNGHGIDPWHPLSGLVGVEWGGDMNGTGLEGGLGLDGVNVTTVDLGNFAALNGTGGDESGGKTNGTVEGTSQESVVPATVPFGAAGMPAGGPS
ncbi:uncharacterized protein KY384_004038 [Bacidia gigantensis]|uniref:uncharacterized protein n=1 Tax=Bacidia gigantensis TaxID=2732470 RepID=UPI001D03982F|nr:uncharacterized protein KY384_004038 [Bacidia gigantensis]KAG8530683.1 hypothetical protein KY384_004038 [Bacidia gigantensis]